MQAHDRSSEIGVIPDNIPTELTSRCQWLNWRYEFRGGRVTKIPLCPHDGRRARTNDPGTWSPFQVALEGARRHRADGIGYVFTSDDPFVGVDIDNCLNPETGEIDDDARNVLFALDSYREVSPSGRGVHSIVKATIPRSVRSGRYEVYDHGRYFTMTGRTVLGSPCAIEQRDRVLPLILERLPYAKLGMAPTVTITPGAVIPGDADIVDRAKRAMNGVKFTRLWDGEWDALQYDSHSEADLALCSLIAYYVPDPHRIDRLFRQSGLFRPKWDSPRNGQTYGAWTIQKALLGRRRP
jgi:putative DNA primase/helicase